MSMLINSKYIPSRGGHAPSDIRDAFCQAIEAARFWDDGEPEPSIVLRGRQVPISRVCGLLWNCRDQLPGIECIEMEYTVPDFPRGATYAQAARAMKLAIARNIT